MPSEFTPRRVVCLQPSATLTMRDIGLLDRVVACTKYCVEVCPEVAEGERRIVSDSWTAQADQIRAVGPDLVIASVPYQADAVGEVLKAGVRFLGFAPRTLADIYGDMTAIAGIMGVPERGAEVIRDMQEAMEEIRTACVNAARKPSVFCEEWGKPLIASQPWVAELVEYAGGDFVGKPGKTTSAEDVARAAPDVVLAAWCGAGDWVPLEKIVTQRNWRDIPAVRSGRIFCISDELLNTPASNLVQGLRAIAWALHPGKFARPTGIRQMAGDFTHPQPQRAQTYP